MVLSTELKTPRHFVRNDNVFTKRVEFQLTDLLDRRFLNSFVHDFLMALCRYSATTTMTTEKNKYEIYVIFPLRTGLTQVKHLKCVRLMIPAKLAADKIIKYDRIN